MKNICRILKVSILLVAMAIGLTVPSFAQGVDLEQQFKEVAVKFVNDMCSGNYDECYTVMDETMKKAMSAEDLKKDWETLKSVTGPIESASVTNTAESNGFYIVVITCRGEVQDLIVQVVMNEDRTVTGLWSVLSPKVEPVEVSYEGVVEEDVVINAGTEWELNGKLTLPAGQEGPFPAAILIHGSGPSDMNETVGGCSPFRDLAVGLARQGIAVLRYDKRTFAHAQQLSQGNVAELTIKEEYVDDVVAAVTLLKSNSRIDSSRIFGIGHSLGATVLPRIDISGADFRGMVLLAGTPRPLWEVSYDQNLMAISTLPEEYYEENMKIVEAEVQKVQVLLDADMEESKGLTAFGLPGYYLKDMMEYPPIELLEKSDKPVMILQGTDDFQVYPDKDFAMFKAKLGSRPNTVLKLYDGLNHLFMSYNGDYKGTVNEYNTAANVDERVISDIGEWINSVK